MNLEENLKQKAKEKRLSEKIKFIALELGKYKLKGNIGFGLLGSGTSVVVEKYKFKKKGLYFEVGSKKTESYIGVAGYNKLYNHNWIQVKQKHWFSKELVYCEVIDSNYKCFKYKPGKWENKLEKIFNETRKKK